MVAAGTIGTFGGWLMAHLSLARGAGESVAREPLRVPIDLGTGAIDSPRGSMMLGSDHWATPNGRRRRQRRVPRGVDEVPRHDRGHPGPVDRHRRGERGLRPQL